MRQCPNVEMELNAFSLCPVCVLQKLKSHLFPFLVLEHSPTREQASMCEYERLALGVSALYATGGLPPTIRFVSLSTEQH